MDVSFWSVLGDWLKYAAQALVAFALATLVVVWIAVGIGKLFDRQYKNQIGR